MELVIVVLAVASGLAQGYALGVEAIDQAQFLVAGLIAVVPVAIVLAGWVRWRPAAALLASIGLATFSTALVVESLRPGSPQPLVAAVGCVLVLGATGLATRRIRLMAVVEGVVLAYASAAWVLEASVLLRPR
jgi:hypothetical protein